jgi:hypothetical protein
MSCVTNAGYETAAGSQASAIVSQAVIDAAIQVGVALWQRNSSKSISNMQRDIADQQMKLAEEVAAHAQIFWAEEAELVNDAFGIAKVTTNYVGLAGAWAGLVDEAEGTGRALWLDVSRQLCLPPDRCQDARWQRNEQLLRSDMLSYAARQDEARTQTLNDLRYERQLAVLAMGRGKVASLTSYQSVGLYSGMQAAGMLESGINSAMQLFGYQRSRTEPPTGWAQGIRQTWEGAAPPPQKREVLPPVAPIEPLPPIRTHVETTQVQGGKDTEIEDAFRELEAQRLEGIFGRPYRHGGGSSDGGIY